MNVRGMLVEGVKANFAEEVQETQLLNSAQQMILEYFDAIGSSLKNEFDNAKSLDFQIRPGSSYFLEIKIGGTGLEFIRESDSIIVKEILENDGRRDYDIIYVSDKTVKTRSYQYITLPETLDQYVQHIFKDFLAEASI